MDWLYSITVYFWFSQVFNFTSSSLSFQLPVLSQSKASSSLANQKPVTWFDDEQFQMKEDQINLTIIIPAYNEENRIGKTLQSYTSYLNASLDERYTIIVVDDGSTDGTVQFVNENFFSSNQKVEVISLPHNQGKGAAVSFGIQYVCNSYPDCNTILVADADGSANIENVKDMFKAMIDVLNISSKKKDLGQSCNNINWSKPVVIVGKRQSSTSFLRSVLRWGFRITVSLLAGNVQVSDTQCGFKLFTPSAAKVLYRDLNLNGWVHDVEVLYRASNLYGYDIREVPIKWKDKDGSKLISSPGGVIGMSMLMLIQVLWLRIAYETELWTIVREENNIKLQD